MCRPPDFRVTNSYHCNIGRVRLAKITESSCCCLCRFGTLACRTSSTPVSLILSCLFSQLLIKKELECFNIFLCFDCPHLTLALYTRPNFLHFSFSSIPPLLYPLLLSLALSSLSFIFSTFNNKVFHGFHLSYPTTTILFPPIFVSTSIYNCKALYRKISRVRYRQEAPAGGYWSLL